MTLAAGYATLTTEQRAVEARVRIEAAHGNWHHIADHPDDPINPALLEGTIRLLHEAGRYLEGA